VNESVWRVTARAMLLLACFGLSACGAARPKVATEVAQDDASQCEHSGRTDTAVEETRTKGSNRNTVRRVFRLQGTGDTPRRVLWCREVDTNGDGKKDVYRRYNDDGEALTEEADADYDGRVDTWIEFAGDRIAEERFDRDGDGVSDEKRLYRRGVLRSVERDTDRDGSPDVWEIYANGELQRLGIDHDHDGQVDSWNRAERATPEPLAQEPAAGAAASQ
jgi:hypothetical protein